MNTQKNKQNIVWGSLLVLFGALGLVQVFTQLPPWTWVAIFGLVGLAILLVYLTDRSMISLLIPVYVFWAIAGLIALTELDLLSGDVIAFYALTAIAIPFLYVYFRNRQNWWALIPAYVMIAVGLMIFLLENGLLNDNLVTTYVMFAIAIPFFVVYAKNSKNWWALIPAGILSIIGVGFLFGQNAFQFVAPVILVLVGVWIVARQFFRKEPPAPEEPELTVSDSDNSLPE